MGQDRRNGNLQDDMRQQEPKPPSSTRTKSSTTISKKSYKKNGFHFEDLFNIMSLGVVYYDHKGRIINVNPAAEMILGLPRDRIENLSAREINPRLVDKDGTKLPVSKIPSMVAMRTGKTVRDTIIGYHNPAVDQIRWVNTNATPLFRNGEKKPYMVYATFSDITEKIEAENKLIRQQEELEIFASLLRHDLGNDLHAIINQIEWAELTHEVDTKDFAESMETIKAITFRMAGLLRSLGRPLEELDYNFGSMLNRIASTSTKAHPGIVVRVNLSDIETRNQNMSSFRLLPTVLDNLIRNSAEHAGRDVEVFISTWMEGSMLLVEICDDGPGIPEGIRDCLFTKGVSTGDGGLGLYLSRRIMEAYNGSISLQESDPNSGACFLLELPVK